MSLTAASADGGTNAGLPNAPATKCVRGLVTRKPNAAGGWMSANANGVSLRTARDRPTTITDGPPSAIAEHSADRPSGAGAVRRQSDGAPTTAARNSSAPARHRAAGTNPTTDTGRHAVTAITEEVTSNEAGHG